jgi:cell division protease FtsH
MEKKAQINLWYFLLVVFLITMIQHWWREQQRVETIAYSEFQTYLNQGRIEEVQVADRYILGTLRAPLPDGRTQVFAIRVEPDLARDLAQHNVRVSGVVENTILRDLLSWIVPIIVFFVVWFFLVRGFAEKQGLGGLMAVGRSKAKVYVERDTRITFDDVAGVDEAKEELKEIVTFLKDPKTYGRLGARIPKGVLLVGPPGTGKTLLARAVAGEAGVPFFSINGSEFVELFVGVGAARVRDLFEQARKHAPCIIFIDELDALGRARSISPVTGGGDEKEQTLNQLLSELDGFDPSAGVVLLAATNRPEILDTALLRAGRFDRQIPLDRPDRKGRLAILKVHTRKVMLADEVELEQVAALTPGFSGADLANLVNEAAIVATRRGGEAVTGADFTLAIERILAGPEKKNRILSQNERRVVAFHEVGHALVALALPGSDAIQKVSIIPRGIGALGYTIQRPIEDRYLMSRTELENKMAVLLGGRAAEVLAFDALSTGAADDLQKATEIARGMVMRYGMDQKLGHASYAQEPPRYLPAPGMAMPEIRTYSEETAREIDCAVRALIGAAFERASAILRHNRRLLDETAARLLERETLQANELPRPSPPLQPAHAA